MLVPLHKDRHAVDRDDASNRARLRPTGRRRLWSMSPPPAIWPRSRPGTCCSARAPCRSRSYVLLDGQVSLTGTAADASSTVIDILGPASSFVLANVLTDEPYLMGAEAVASSRLVRIGGGADAPGGGAPTGRRHGDDARDVGGTRQHDAAGGGPEGAHRGAAARHVSAEPGEGADRDTGPVPAAGPQGAAGALARLPRREPVARLHVVARLWRGDAWFPGGAARRLAPAGLCRRDRAGDGGAIARQPVEKVFGDAFRLRSKRSGGV